MTRSSREGRGRSSAVASPALREEYSSCRKLRWPSCCRSRLADQEPCGVAQRRMGFQPQNVLVMKATGFSRWRKQRVLWRSVVASRRAAGSRRSRCHVDPARRFVPVGHGSLFHRSDAGAARPDDRTAGPDDDRGARWFAAFGIPQKAGRDFNESDTGTMPLVAIVSEGLVRKSLVAKTRLAGRSSARSTGRTQ